MISFQAQMSGQPQSEEDTIKTALTELVNAELLKQESIRKKIVPAPEAVDTELKKMKSQFPDEETFKSEIGKQGLTLEEVRKNVSTQLALREMLKTEIEDKIKISDEDINKFYTANPDYFKTGESVKASHILIKSEEGDDEAKVAEAKKKIEEILAKVKGGADFAKTAEENSEGPSAPNGGDLGFFSSGQMVKPFEDAAFRLKKGDVSDIVKTRFGFHIIKVIDKKEAGMTPLKDVRDKIEQYLLKMAGNEMLNEYLTKLRGSSTIVQNI
jgi:peptidyl-prolyl cis-trans isomerase C